MFIEVSKGIKLTTGEIVKGYFVDGEGKKAIHQLIADQVVLGIKLESTLRQVTALEAVARTAIVRHYRERIRQSIFSNVSFRLDELVSGLALCPQHRKWVREAFESLIAEGRHIENRGSGWYRGR